MTLNISINLSPEIKYEGDKTTYLNPADLKRQNQSFSVNTSGFNFDGSLQELTELINDWIKKVQAK